MLGPVYHCYSRQVSCSGGKHSFSPLVSGFFHGWKTWDTDINLNTFAPQTVWGKLKLNAVRSAAELLSAKEERLGWLWHTPMLFSYLESGVGFPYHQLPSSNDHVLPSFLAQYSIRHWSVTGSRQRTAALWSILTKAEAAVSYSSPPVPTKGTALVTCT